MQQQCSLAITSLAFSCVESLMASNRGHKQDYHTLLTSLSQRLSKEDFNSLVFSCGDVLPRSATDSVMRGTDLFRELSQRGHLGPSNYDYLRDKLEQVGRSDLASSLPDQFEILFGQVSGRGKVFFGGISSPVVPAAAVCPGMDFQLPKSTSLRSPGMVHRMFLLRFSEQLTSEELEKLAFLVCPKRFDDHLTASRLRFGLADLLENGENVISLQFIDLLSTCLEAIGRADLAQHLCSLTAPQALLSSFSTSQQQLDLKISLLLHSKHQSYDFHMRALTTLERDDNYRLRLLEPLMNGVYKSYCHSSILPLAQDLQTVLQNWNRPDDLNELIQASLQKVFDFNQAYMTRIRFLENQGGRELCLERLHEINSKCSKAYDEFDSIMDYFEWNSDVRSEVKRNEKYRATPFGTPADIACDYIFDLCQETSRCGSGLHQERQQAEKCLQILHSIFGCCCCNLVMLQWLATLLCLSTSFSPSTHSTLDLLSNHKTLLLNLVKQVKDDITDLYPMISLIVGSDFLQKIAPFLEPQIGAFQPTGEPQWLEDVPSVNPFALFFHVFLVKLLAVASLGLGCIGVYDVHLTDQLLTSHTSYASHVILLIASGMKQQVEAFQKRALAEDRLCERLITALTTTDVEH